MSHPRFRHTPISLAAVALLLSACATTAAQKPAEVAATKTATAPKETAATPKVLQPSSARETLDWRRYFSPPPAPEDRPLIARRVETWKDAGDAPTLVDRGHHEMALGRLAEADRSFREALRVEPKSVEAMLGTAEVSLRRHQTDRVFNLLSSAKNAMDSRDSNPPGLMLRWRFVRALALGARGDQDASREELNSIITDVSDFFPAYAALASSYLADHKNEAARFVARRGLDRGVDDASLANILGVVEERGGRDSEADTWYSKALEINKGYGPALVNRGKLRLKSGDLPAARDLFITALQNLPEDVEALVGLGVVERRLKNPEAARASFQKAIDINPESAAARYNLALLMAEDLNQPGMALRLFHEVLQTRDTNADVKRLARGWIGDLEEPTRE
jgi:tetratricopeptide (TPR) repeat protein